MAEPSHAAHPLIRATGRGRRLILLRHGRTDYNASGRFQGKLDPPLDDVGRTQAQVAAEAIAALKPAALLASTAQRAHQTALALAERCGLELDLDERLTEVDNGRWAGLTLEEVRERYRDEHDGWRRGDDIKIGGAESYREVSVRASAAIAGPLDARDDGELLVVITHGGVARAVAAATLGLPHEHWRILSGLGNCTWSMLSERPQRWVLEGHGLSG
ncbi:MAG: glucosyl-3-phosphoglycerate phosphatase [Frankiaceae bacterium]|nr:glucosyl-3-phosphoglycerate phosphatase [Frankiaceae bacterium]MDQ1673446.1 glucosyl-3-phosphoglycerate phosphatase [Frankiaceae bacterium]